MLMKNFRCLESLYFYSKPLFFKDILKNLQQIQDNKLLTKLDHIDLTDMKSYEMVKFKAVLQGTNMQLKQFMENFLNLKTNYRKCFADINGIIKMD